MEDIARPFIARIDAIRFDAIVAVLKRRWRRILLECCVLAAFALTTSLIARG